jgi:hypothetical protein
MTVAHPEAEASTLLARLATAAHECAALLGLPVAIDDDEVHAALKAAGHNLTTPARQRLALAAGFYPFPTGTWRYHSPELRVLCTSPVDPRPVAMWDESLWLTAQRLLQTNGKENKS